MDKKALISIEFSMAHPIQGSQKYIFKKSGYKQICPFVLIPASPI
jgi:hypothetical protein